MGPFTRVAAAEEKYIAARSAVRRRLCVSCKAQKKATSVKVVKKVRVMSKITMRASRKNSRLVTRVSELHRASQNPKNRRAKRKTTNTQPTAAKAEGKRADH